MSIFLALFLLPPHSDSVVSLALEKCFLFLLLVVKHIWAAFPAPAVASLRPRIFPFGSNFASGFLFNMTPVFSWEEGHVWWGNVCHPPGAVHLVSLLFWKQGFHRLELPKGLCLLGRKHTLEIHLPRIEYKGVPLHQVFQTCRSSCLKYFINQRRHSSICHLELWKPGAVALCFKSQRFF